MVIPLSLLEKGYREGKKLSIANIHSKLSYSSYFKKNPISCPFQNEQMLICCVL